MWGITNSRNPAIFWGKIHELVKQMGNGCKKKWKIPLWLPFCPFCRIFVPQELQGFWGSGIQQRPRGSESPKSSGEFYPHWGMAAGRNLGIDFFGTIQEWDVQKILISSMTAPLGGSSQILGFSQSPTFPCAVLIPCWNQCWEFFSWKCKHLGLTGLTAPI